MKALILDNYDSFTYNLYQYAGEILAAEGKPFTLDVVRNDALTLNEIKKRKYDRIIVSPGPGDPADKAYFGGRVVRAEKPMHGKTSTITHDGKVVFAGLPQHLEVMRYHSLVADEKALPASLVVTSRSEDSREIMGLRHVEYPIEGIQFHPESFATQGGKEMLKNFLRV